MNSRHKSITLPQFAKYYIIWIVLFNNGRLNAMDLIFLTRHDGTGYIRAKDLKLSDDRRPMIFSGF